jgi:hypothetical protein
MTMALSNESLPLNQSIHLSQTVFTFDKGLLQTTVRVTLAKAGPSSGNTGADTDNVCTRRCCAERCEHIMTAKKSFLNLVCRTYCYI